MKQADTIRSVKRTRLRITFQTFKFALCFRLEESEESDDMTLAGG
eukprot:COSAG06_NODE_2294_length_7143_cov_5.506388_8_plen_45_part_00